MATLAADCTHRPELPAERIRISSAVDSQITYTCPATHTPRTDAASANYSLVGMLLSILSSSACSSSSHESTSDCSCAPCGGAMSGVALALATVNCDGPAGSWLARGPASVCCVCVTRACAHSESCDLPAEACSLTCAMPSSSSLDSSSNCSDSVADGAATETTEPPTESADGVAERASAWPPEAGSVQCTASERGESRGGEPCGCGCGISPARRASW